MDYVCNGVRGKHVSNIDHVRGAGLIAPWPLTMVPANALRSVSSHLNKSFDLHDHSLLSEDLEGNKGDLLISHIYHGFT
jgi:hypothetical protein